MNPTLQLTEPRASLHFVARDRAPLDRVLHNLKEVGYAANEISVLFMVRRELRRGRPAARPDESPPPSSTDIRGVVAWLDGAQAVVIPGSAPLIVAGPLARSFHPVSPNGIVDALVSIGLSEAEARRCVYQVLDGGFLIVVRSDHAVGLERAQLIFEAEAGAAVSGRYSGSNRTPPALL